MGLEPRHYFEWPTISYFQANFNAFWPVLDVKSRHLLVQGGPHSAITSINDVFWLVVGPKPRHFPVQGGPHSTIIKHKSCVLVHGS